MSLALGRGSGYLLFFEPFVNFPYSPKINSYTATIDDLKSSNEYLEEYNAYLQDDLLHYNLPSDYTSTKNRHDLRIYNNPFLRAMQTP